MTSLENCMSISARCRLNLDITQVELATLLGVHPISVSHWERGTSTPTPWQNTALNMLNEIWTDEMKPKTASNLIAQDGGFEAFRKLCELSYKFV